MKILTKQTVAALGLVLLVGIAPNSAHAKGSLHLELPGLSIGLHDNDRRYRSSRRHYNRNYHNNHHDEYRGRDRRYHKKYRHHKRYYKNHHNGHHNNNYSNKRYNRYDNRYDNQYNDNYYYGGQSNRNDGYYNQSQRAQICPTAGYSRYRDRNRSCYQHKDHYHCD